MSVDLSLSLSSTSIDLYSAAASVSTGNFMISPLSIVYANVLLYLAARGATRKNLYDSLHFNESFNGVDANIAGAFGDAISKLLPSQKSESANLRLALVNALCVDKTLKLEKEYVAAVNPLKASVESKDFSHNPEGSRVSVNQWAEQQTSGIIKDLIPQGKVTGSTRGVMANALYFKSTWDQMFNSSLTEKSTFTQANGQKASTLFMKTKGKYVRSQDKSTGVTINYLEIPYKKEEASLLILLPSEKDGLQRFEKNFTIAAFRKITSGRKVKRDINLVLPKFTLESNFDLKTIMEKIGIKNVFSDNADLSDLTKSEGLSVSSAFHKTFVGKFSYFSQIRHIFYHYFLRKV